MSKNTNYKKAFTDIMRKLTQTRSSWTVWQDFVISFACEFSNAASRNNFEKREELYKAHIKNYTESERKLLAELFVQMVYAFEENPEQDFLGELFMDLGLNNNMRGQFFTPYDVCKTMSAITLADIAENVKKKGIVTINDCACGAGATLIASINEAKRLLSDANLNYQQHIYIVAQDIDFTTAMMCYLQISLLGVAGCVKVGNTLANPISDEDDISDYWFTPMCNIMPWVKPTD